MYLFIHLISLFNSGIGSEWVNIRKVEPYLTLIIFLTEIKIITTQDGNLNTIDMHLKI